MSGRACMAWAMCGIYMWVITHEHSGNKRNYKLNLHAIKISVSLPQLQSILMYLNVNNDC